MPASEGEGDAAGGGRAAAEAASRVHPFWVLLPAAVLAVALLLFEMSRSAPRIAGSDHVGVPVFAATVPGGGEVCEPVDGLPADAARVQLLIGTYGRPVPRLAVTVSSARGVVGGGVAPAGQGEGTVLVPLGRLRDPDGVTLLCLRVGGRSKVVIGGEAGPGGRATVNGKREPGDIGLTYLRAGVESWWQLLPTLVTRFGLGKSPWVGSWALPVVIIVMIGIWIATLRLLAKELR